MLGKNKIEHFTYGEREIIVDEEYQICISVKKEDFDERALNYNESSIMKAINVKRSWMKRNQNQVNSVYLLITEKRNLSCRFCSLKVDKHSSNENINLENFESRLLPLLKEINPRKIIITGGEPFMNKDVLYILKKVKEILPETYILLQSNGFLLEHEEHIEELSHLINHIEISSSHYNDLKQLEHIIERLHQYHIDVCLSFITDGTLERLDNIIDFVVQNQVAFLLNFVTPLGSAVDNDVPILSFDCRLNILKHIFEYVLENDYIGYHFLDLVKTNINVQNSCSALGKTMAIHPDGNCYICHSMHDQDCYIGNYKSMEIVDVMKAWQRLIKNPKTINIFSVDGSDKCKSCNLRYLCGGLCAATKQNETYSEACCQSQKFMLALNLLYFENGNNERENMLRFVELCDHKEELINIPV